MPVRWKTDLDKLVVVTNFERRGWEQVAPSDDDWDIYWCSVGSIKLMFGVESGLRLQPGQLVNHFPNHYELTRKDLMVKNIKRYQKAVRRDGGAAAQEDLDIIPATFVLPQDYMLFVEEFRRCPHSTWIMKPSGKSQGKGIFLINRLSQVKKWSCNAVMPPALRNSQESYVVSRYLDRPLLIGGKKFDLRLYVVVTSYKPLTVYLSSLGFARFCNTKYTIEEDELDNEFVHLTNVAIQKHGLDYNDKHGNKWSLDNLRLYLEATRGIPATDQLFKDIEGCVVKSLKAVQNILINDRHCFELYGYDLLTDQTLKPWLLEVNASPSLTTTTSADRLLKFKVISDVLNLVTPPEWVALSEEELGPGAVNGPLREVRAAAEAMTPRSGPRETMGSFRLIYDEQAEKDAGARQPGCAVPASSSGGPTGMRRSVSMTDHAPGALSTPPAAWYAGGAPGSDKLRHCRPASARPRSSGPVPAGGDMGSPHLAAAPGSHGPWTKAG